MGLTQLSLTNYCGNLSNVKNKSNQGNNQKIDIIDYCRFQSQIKAVVQKDNKMNTSYNTTQISNAMRYSQLVR
jgi:hypothetical protein